MTNELWIALGAAGAAALVVLAATWAGSGRRVRTAREAVAQSSPNASAAAPQTRAEIGYASEATEEAFAQYFKLAFGVVRFDYQILGQHARVLEQVELSLCDAAERQEYFPRKPRLLPRLLQTLNDSDSTRQELVRLILEDPALASATLKRANNAFYRANAQPVESLDRAVVVLGTDGLRSLVSLAILQPVFHLPKGFFDNFAGTAWEQAQRSAASAQAYAATTGEEDPLIAQLLGVLPSLATLVSFRLTLDTYRCGPGVMPRPEVFIQLMRRHRMRLAHEIGKTWQLTDISLAALEQQCHAISPPYMSGLARAMYYGDLAGTACVAAFHGRYSSEQAQALLRAQGLTPALADTVWDAASSADLGS